MSTIGSIQVESGAEAAAEATEPIPEASWDLYEMIQAFLQVSILHLQ